MGNVQRSGVGKMNTCLAVVSRDTSDDYETDIEFVEVFKDGVLCALLLLWLQRYNL